jgi:hypothetical protein
LVAKLVGVLNQVKRVTNSVEETANNVHDVVKGVKSVVTPAVITNAITGWIEKLTANKSDKKEKKSE